jgi:hypothetical protein
MGHQSAGNPALAILTVHTVTFHKYTIMEYLGLQKLAQFNPSDEPLVFSSSL